MDPNIGIIRTLRTATNLGELESEGKRYHYISDFVMSIGDWVIFDFRTIDWNNKLVLVGVNLRKIDIGHGVEFLDDIKVLDFDEMIDHKFGHVTDPVMGSRSDYSASGGYSLIWIDYIIHASNIGTASIGSGIHYHTSGVTTIQGPNGSAFAPILSSLLTTKPPHPH